MKNSEIYANLVDVSSQNLLLMEDQWKRKRPLWNYMMLKGYPMRTIARKLGVSATRVLRWIRTFAEKTYARADPGSAKVVEIDEMWHYVDSN